MVAGERVLNKEMTHQPQQRKTVVEPQIDYRYRDINEERLNKWEIYTPLTARTNIISTHHIATKSGELTKFKPSRKLMSNVSIHHNESKPELFKPSLRQVNSIANM